MSAQGKRIILVAEDDVRVRKMVTLRLTFEGFGVVVAGDGEEALQQAEAAGRLDLILLDVKMPKLNGFQVCKRLKANPFTAKIPVIIFTASASHFQRLADRCIEYGATDWLKKPFRSQDLLGKIRRALGEEGGSHA